MKIKPNEIEGDVKFKNKVNVVESTTLESTLEVQDKTILKKDTEITDIADFKNDAIKLKQDTIINGTLEVKENITIDKSAQFKDTCTYAHLVVYNDEVDFQDIAKFNTINRYSLNVDIEATHTDDDNYYQIKDTFNKVTSAKDDDDSDYVRLPSMKRGMYLEVINETSHKITLECDGEDTIDDEDTKELSSGSKIRILCIEDEKAITTI